MSPPYHISHLSIARTTWGNHRKIIYHKPGRRAGAFMQLLCTSHIPRTRQSVSPDRHLSCHSLVSPGYVCDCTDTAAVLAVLLASYREGVERESRRRYCTLRLWNLTAFVVLFPTTTSRQHANPRGVDITSLRLALTPCLKISIGQLVRPMQQRLPDDG